MDFFTALGGKGANQAVQCALMGCRVRFVGCVGSDAHGDEMKRNFQKHGICVQNLKTAPSGVSSGMASIMVEHATGHNRIVIVRGANGELSGDDVREAWTDVVEGGTGVVVCQLETSVEVALESFRLAKQQQQQCATTMVTVLNPAPAMRDVPNELLQLTDVIVPNEEEAATLIAAQSEGEEEHVTIETVEDAMAAAKKLASRGPRIVIITLGDKGCVLYEKDSDRCVHVPTMRVSPVDTTGAGDAFIGALAFGLSRSWDAERCCRLGNIVASMSTMASGAQTSYGTFEQVVEKAKTLMKQ